VGGATERTGADGLRAGDGSNGGQRRKGERSSGQAAVPIADASPTSGARRNARESAARRETLAAIERRRVTEHRHQHGRRPTASHVAHAQHSPQHLGDPAQYAVPDPRAVLHARRRQCRRLRSVTSTRVEGLRSAVTAPRARAPRSSAASRDPVRSVCSRSWLRRPQLAHLRSNPALLV